MRVIVQAFVVLAVAGCGSSKNTSSESSATPSAGSATPGSAATAPAIDPATLADLDDAGLATLRLRLSYQGAPVGPSTKRGEYRIDAESFEHDGLRPDGTLGALGARKTGASLRDIVGAMRRHGIAARPEVANPGCAGGSTYTLELALGDRASTLRAYTCAGKAYGTLAGDVKALAADLEWLLPDATRRLPRS